MAHRKSPPYENIVGVLTGDLVGSTAATSVQVTETMDQIERTARDLSDLAGADTRFTRFRGDGWQIVMRSAAHVLRASLLVIADLRASGTGLETRISVGVGPYESLGTRNLSDATGHAFFVSGHHLDTISRNRRMVIAGGPLRDRDWQAAIFDLVEWQSRAWTKAQAEAVAIALRQTLPTHQDMAAKLGITRQAMQARLASAGFAALAVPLAAFETFDWEAGP